MGESPEEGESILSHGASQEMKEGTRDGTVGGMDGAIREMECPRGWSDPWDATFQVMDPLKGWRILGDRVFQVMEDPKGWRPPRDGDPQGMEDPNRMEDPKVVEEHSEGQLLLGHRETQRTEHPLGKRTS